MKPKLILCLALVLSGGLFGCSKPLRQTHKEIPLSNGGIIRIDGTECRSSDINFLYKASYKSPNDDKYEYFADWADDPSPSIFVVGDLVVIAVPTEQVLLVRTNDKNWKWYQFGWLPLQRNDFSEEDIQRISGNNTNLALNCDLKSFDPKKRTLLAYYENGKITTYLTLELSEDGNKLHLINSHEVKVP